MNTQELAQQALSRAQSGNSLTNYPAIYSGFMALGISAADIKPRENILSFNAWKALGRSVKKGEHGVKIVTFAPCTKTDKATGEVTEFRRPWTVTVFHISQTEVRS